MIYGGITGFLIINGKRDSKADRVEERKRQMKNLEWRSSEAAQIYRQKLAAAEQRSRDLARPPPTK